MSKGDHDKLFVFFEANDRVSSIQATIPPQMTEKEFNILKSYGETVEAAMNYSMIAFIVSHILIGGLLAQLIGMIKTLQFINMQLMLNYKYRARMLLFISYCVQAAELDILQGQKIYEAVFDFKETDPFNEAFELFGTGDMNFMMNLSSLPLWFSLGILIGIYYKFMMCFAKIGYRSSCCRKTGIYVE